MSTISTTQEEIVIALEIAISYTVRVFSSYLPMFFHNSIQVVEPIRGQQLMIALNSWIVKHDLLIRLLPWTADIFVFTYPVYLVGLYLRGLSKHNDYYKYASFAIVFSA